MPPGTPESLVQAGGQIRVLTALQALCLVPTFGRNFFPSCDWVGAGLVGW